MRKTEQNLRFIYKMSDVLEKNFLQYLQQFFWQFYL